MGKTAMTTTHASKRWFWEVAIAVAIVAGIVASVAWGRSYDTGTHNNQGHANFERGRYRQAISDYDRALRREPDAAHLYGNRGLAKAILGQYREAIADYDQALRLEPDAAYIYE
ncbi:MAG: tetratricopeptide repeat protein, partial [Acidimicrobiia bacterium]|nr:tetratricopeptide repeat protein [Acidimicrobiia bacterium]